MRPWEIFGFVVGFVIYGATIFFAVFMLTRDGIEMHKNYDEMIAQKKRTLVNEFGCTEEQLVQMEKDFFSNKNKGQEENNAISIVN